MSLDFLTVNELYRQNIHIIVESIPIHSHWWLVWTYGNKNNHYCKTIDPSSSGGNPFQNWKFSFCLNIAKHEKSLTQSIDWPRIILISYHLKIKIHASIFFFMLWAEQGVMVAGSNPDIWCTEEEENILFMIMLGY